MLQQHSRNVPQAAAIVIVENINNGNDDDIQRRPTLKLSRCCRQRDIHPLPSSSDAAATAAAAPKRALKSKRPKSVKKPRLVIPSFSPILEMDTSILDSPVAQEATKLECAAVSIPEKNIVGGTNENHVDDDDDDEDLFWAIPIFRTKEEKAKRRRDELEKNVMVHACSEDTNQLRNQVVQPDENVTPSMEAPDHSALLPNHPTLLPKVPRGVSKDNTSHGTNDKESTQLMLDDHPQWSTTFIESIDNLFRQADPSTVTVRDIMTALEAEHSQVLPPTMRKMVKKHLKKLMSGTVTPSSAMSKSVQGELLVNLDYDNNAQMSPIPEANVLDSAYDPDDDEGGGGIEMNQVLEPEQTTENLKLPSSQGPTAGTLNHMCIATERRQANETNENDETDALTKDEAVALDLDPAQGTEDSSSPPHMSPHEPQRKADQQLATENDNDNVVLVMENPSPIGPLPMREKVESPREIIETKVPVEDRRPVERGVPSKLDRCKGPDTVHAKSQGRRKRDLVTTKTTTEVEHSGKLQEPIAGMETTRQVRPNRSRARKGTCAMCSTCTCTTVKDLNDSQHTTDGCMGLARSDAEMERNLIRRMLRLEKTVGMYEGLLDTVKRELKKHRRAIWKKQEAQRPVGTNKQYAFGNSRFLPDARVWDMELGRAGALEKAVPGKLVQQAKVRLFAKSASYQPTLTQMLRGGRCDNGTENVNDVIVAIDSDTDLTTAVPNDSDELESSELGDIVDDDDCPIFIENEPAIVPLDKVHRLTWNDGGQTKEPSGMVQRPGVWTALTTSRSTRNVMEQKIGREDEAEKLDAIDSSDGNPIAIDSVDKYKCAWDRLFEEHLSHDDSGMQQLLNLFEHEVMQANPASTGIQHCHTQDSCDQSCVVDVSKLTPRGERLANMIEYRLAADLSRRRAVEAACPNWKENIRFALAQRGEERVREALQNVRHSRNRLESAKESIQTSWTRYELVFELFEMALTESLKCLEAKNASTNQDESGLGFPLLRVHNGWSTCGLSPIGEIDEQSCDGGDEQRDTSVLSLGNQLQLEGLSSHESPVR